MEYKDATLILQILLVFLPIILIIVIQLFKTSSNIFVDINSKKYSSYKKDQGFVLLIVPVVYTIWYCIKYNIKLDAVDKIALAWVIFICVYFIISGFRAIKIVKRSKRAALNE